MDRGRTNAEVKRILLGDSDGKFLSFPDSETGRDTDVREIDVVIRQVLAFEDGVLKPEAPITSVRSLES